MKRIRRAQKEAMTYAQGRRLAKKSGRIRAKKCVKCGSSMFGGELQLDKLVEKCTDLNRETNQACGGRMMWLKNSKHDGEIH